MKIDKLKENKINRYRKEVLNNARHKREIQTFSDK